jgi:hypothetical protein
MKLTDERENEPDLDEVLDERNQPLSEAPTPPERQRTPLAQKVFENAIERNHVVRTKGQAKRKRKHERK